MRSRWLWSAFGFLMMTAYWPDISGVATTPRWGVAALLVLALFVAPRGVMTRAHWFGLTFLGWLALTLLWSLGEGRLDGIDEALQLVLIAVAFVVAAIECDCEALFIGAAVGIGINSALALVQWYGFAYWYGWRGPVDVFGLPAGLFFNSERLAAAAAMVTAGLMVGGRRAWLLPLCLPALIVTHSSAAILAVGAAAFVLSSRWIVRGPLVAAAISVVAIKFGGISADERIVIWRDTILQLNWLGHGLGSFRESFFAHWNVYDILRFNSRPEHPHNEWLWLAYEGGIVGVGLAGALALRIFAAADTQGRAILTAFFVLGLFWMPLHDPATAILAACVAGHCVGCRVRDDECALLRRVDLRPRMATDPGPGKPVSIGTGALGLPVPAAVS